MAIKISGETVVDDSKKGLFNDVVVKGGAGESGEITLNCENNSHGVKLKGPAHSAGADYTLTLPDTSGSSGEVLTTDGSGAMSWEEVVGNEISATAPTSPSQGALWTDTSEDPAAPILKTWNGSAWVAVGSAAPSEFAPVVNNVVLTENDTTGARFTSQTFDVSMNMLVEGSPFSQKGIKGEVTASFEEFPNSDPVNSNTNITFPNDQRNAGQSNNADNGMARVYAPNMLGRWQWYGMRPNGSNQELLDSDVSDVGGMLHQNEQLVTYNTSVTPYYEATYLPPTPGWQYHTIFAYFAEGKISYKQLVWTRPVDGSSDWVGTSEYYKAIPQYDEETQRWFSMKSSGYTMYVEKGLHPFNSQVAPDQSYSAATNIDEYNGSIAIGNGRVVCAYRNNSSGQPYAFSMDKNFGNTQIRELSSSNAHTGPVKFFGGYFYVIVDEGYGVLKRSSDGITWTPLNSAVPSDHAALNIFEVPTQGIIELHTRNSTNNTVAVHTSNNSGATWVQEWDSPNLGNQYGYVFKQGGKVAYYRREGSYVTEEWWPYNKQTVVLSGTGADYSDFNVGDVVRPAGSTDANEYGNIESISGTTIEIQSEYIYQVGDVLESIYATSSSVSSRYLVIDASGAVSGTVVSDPGFVSVGPNTSQTLTFPATFASGDTPDEELPAGTTIKVSVEATNSEGSSTFGPSNIVTPS